MKLKNKRIGICISEIPPNQSIFLKQIRNLENKENAIINIINCFNTQEEKNEIAFMKQFERNTSNKIMNIYDLIKGRGKKDMFDVLMIIPCSENIIPEISHNILDKPSIRLANYQALNNKPIVIGLYANNALSYNAENIGRLLNKKNYYFIPFKQPNPITNPYCISFDYSYLSKTLQFALESKQIQPILLSL